MMNEQQMTDLSSEAQAKKAISHVLQQIRDSPEVGYHLGLGTQSFSLLTEAAATLFGEPLETIRANFLPRNPKKPKR